MRILVLAMACLTAACASTYAANPEDPVDMTAQLGDRGRAYVGMGEVCDIAAGGAHREAIVAALRSQQARLGALSGLVNRAYRGQASEALAAHMRAQLTAHRVDESTFCGVVVQQANAEFAHRTATILTLSGQYDPMLLVREGDRARYPDTPHFDPEIGYTSWLD